MACPVVSGDFYAGKDACPMRHYPGGEGSRVHCTPFALWKRQGVYRIIFHIREEDQHVRILRIWHASRDAITAADIAN
jgi:plasmid stabilization system protein ParE